jgi:integrase/recombinase XerD
MQIGKARVQTDSEFRRLVNVTKIGSNGLRNIGIVVCSYQLGLRACEISALTVKYVCDDRGNLKEECNLSAAQTKGGKPRTVYLTNQTIRSALKDYIQWRRDTEDILFCNASPLFRSTKGGGFSPNTLQILLHKLHESAGIQGGRSHSGRRWFATELISKGVDIKSVSVLMGHASVSMTAQYAEDNPQRLRRIAAELV